MVAYLIALFFIVISSLIWFYQTFSIKTVNTHYVKSPRNEKIISNCKELHKGYHPPFIWGTNGHLQTFYHLLFRRSPNLHFRRVRIDSLEGVINLDLHPASETLGDETPIVIVIPGISGSSKLHYVKNFVNAVSKSGWKSAVINHKGCNSSLESPSLYKIGGTHELRRVLEYLHEQYPKAPLFAVGFSMGANILINYIGEYHKKDSNFISKNEKSNAFDKNNNNNNQNTQYIPLLAGVSVSQSFDLITSSQFIPKHRPFYSWGLKGKVADVVKRHRKVFEQEYKDIDIDFALKANSLPEFDRRFTCKILKYESPEEYYKAQCCSKNVPHLGIPTLLLNALDDPIIPGNVLNPVVKVSETNENVILVTTKWGGHLGFHEGFVPSRVTWMDKFVVEFLHSVLNLEKNK